MRDRDKAILKSLLQEKMGAAERVGLAGMVYCVLADDGTCYAGQMKRQLISGGGPSLQGFWGRRVTFPFLD